MLLNSMSSSSKALMKNLLCSIQIHGARQPGPSAMVDLGRKNDRRYRAIAIASIVVSQRFTNRLCWMRLQLGFSFFLLWDWASFVIPPVTYSPMKSALLDLTSTAQSNLEMLAQNKRFKRKIPGTIVWSNVLEQAVFVVVLGFALEFLLLVSYRRG